MCCRDFGWQALLFITCIFSLLAITNILSMFPINLHEFDTLPMEVQADITTNVKYRLSEYKNRLAVHQMKMPEHDLMLHLNPQVCYKGEQAPDGTGPWPEEMTHYFCASRDLVDWCLKDYKLYQTTEKVYPLTNGRDLHVSVTCYRIRLFNRYLDDVNIPICVIALIMSTYIFHSWLARWRNPQGEDSNGNSPAHTPSPPTSPPPPPSKRKQLTQLLHIRSFAVDTKTIGAGDNSYL